MNKKLKIVFMGTPDFAVPSLSALHEAGHDIGLVVTQPDRPKGRGRKLNPPPVKTRALELGLDVFQPESMKTDEVFRKISLLEPDLFIVIAFGHILKKPLLDVPKMGAINIHASILPKLRGSAPIQWAIINGEKETGVTTMLLDEGMDTGDILLMEKLDILPDDTAGTLHDRLSVVGAGLLAKTLEEMAAGTLTPIPQDHSRATCAPMLKKKDGRMDWEKPAETLETFIRGMAPWPGAFTFHGKKRLKIFRAEIAKGDKEAAPGEILQGFPGELRVAAGRGALSILEIQGASGKRLLIEDFLKGYKISVGERLE